MQSYNEPEEDKSEKGVWQCNLELDGDYIESALSSSDESSPVKNNEVSLNMCESVYLHFMLLRAPFILFLISYKNECYLII